MTPNGRLAIVRGHAPGNDRIDGITVVDTSTGNKLPLQGSHPNTGLGGYRNPSDFVQATNSRAILIGGRDTDTIPGEDTTYVDVLAFDMATTPPTVTCISHHELGGPSQPAGRVSDVEITPDETFAIVNSRNWIHVVRLSDGSIAQGFYLYAAPYAGYCEPGFQADSVATTDTTAVVTTTRLETSGAVTKSRVWVYLIDLSEAQDPAVQFEHNLSYSDTFDPVDYDPHDLAITPNGQFAVVAASEVVGVYDLTSKTFLARYKTLDQGIRLFSETVDSVVVTNSRAVVVGKDRAGAQPPYSHLWTLYTFALPPDPASYPAMSPLYSFSSRTLGNGYSLDPPHDLAIDSSGTKAVIRTFNHAVVLTDLNAVPPSAPTLTLFDLGAATPQRVGGQSQWAFASDSVQIAPDFWVEVPIGGGSGHRHYAMVTGYNTTTRDAYVDVIDLASSPPSAAHTFTIDDPTPEDLRILPADIELGIARDFWVRFDAPGEPTAGLGTGLDVGHFGLDPLAEIAFFGGKGKVWAVDSMVRRRAVAGSVAEDVQFGTGLVHIVRP